MAQKKLNSKKQIWLLWQWGETLTYIFVVVVDSIIGNIDRNTSMVLYY